MPWRNLRSLPAVAVPLVLAACAGGGGGGGAGGGAAPAGLVNPTSSTTVVLLDLTSLATLTTVPTGPNAAAVLANGGTSFFPVQVNPTAALRTGAGGLEEFTLRIPELAVQETFSSQDIRNVPDPHFQDVSWAVGTKPFGNGGEVTLYLLNPDPRSLRYDTFGLWTVAPSSTVSSITVGAVSLGAPAPIDQIPRTGVGTYDGVLSALRIGAFDGAEVSAMASATVDFSLRQIDFRTSATVSMDILTNVVSPAPGLDISGRLTYASGTNAASGTLRTSDGMSGPAAARFVGPAAAELGGTFVLTDPAETARLIGGFGLRAP